ncbi:acyl-CoA N-acyltransferase [Aspergillus varians]
MPPVRRATRKVRTGIRKVLRRAVSDKPKPLPLVERTNALSREDFISSYIPAPELIFQKKRKTIASQSSTAQTEENGTQADPLQTQDEISTGSPETDSYELSIYTASTISNADLNSCFKLIELTSSTAYKSSSMGWSPTEKREEMKLPDMKYIILRRRAAATVSNGDQDQKGDSSSSDAGEFAGFLEFMVTYEDGYEVLYCYEIHFMPEMQGLGLGEELMERFERIGRAIGLEKAMLTVFKSNSRAVKFYTRVGYTEDESSPRPRRLRNGVIKEFHYLIMSKSLR